MSLFLTCATSLQFKIKKNDNFLIHTQYKIIERGYIKFVKLNNSIPVREIIYYYVINKKNNKIAVSLIENKSLDTTYNIRDYKTSDEWNLKHQNTWREKYFKILHKDFLYMSNEQKFCLLDSLSSNR